MLVYSGWMVEVLEAGEAADWWLCTRLEDAGIVLLFKELVVWMLALFALRGVRNGDLKGLWRALVSLRRFGAGLGSGVAI